ncbi:sigma 54-interacting transcriptional regulator [Ruegeria sp. HKCCA4008]|uniref:sigma 54-interacting transcriptional regulator n=1 Tax=Ruegeria sp. HKCCA4008 TaxID=2682999 RepID=UPI001488F66E|nr:sigma 54-interacting transcriptional regulator [Ruegeria sp. HKCCA4008]
MSSETLLCWASVNHGPQVLSGALEALAGHGHSIERVLLLVQEGREVPEDLPQHPRIETIAFAVADPTDHATLYKILREELLPQISALEEPLHVNISPGTPAMHAVWLVLATGGAFPPGTRLWSSQRPDPEGPARIAPVEFAPTTWLSALRADLAQTPQRAAYDPEALSAVRRAALDRLARYARVPGVPLLILGERGVGKTRVVESLVAKLKGDRHVVTFSCGHLKGEGAEALLFGHADRLQHKASAADKGLLHKADGGILFVDEVQDLPRDTQRLLLPVLQGRVRRWRRLGETEQQGAKFDLVCASNLPLAELEKTLDPDFFDRIAHLQVELPPLRDCPADLRDDWSRVWRETGFPGEPPWSPTLERALMEARLPRNIRDLQRLAAIIVSTRPDGPWPVSLQRQALEEWRATGASPPGDFGTGTRKQRLHWFQRRLALWAKERYGTWQAAASELACDESTLRVDAKGEFPTESK